MFRCFCLLCLLLSNLVSIHSQNIVVSGYVVDSITAEPLPFVNIAGSDYKTGCYSDLNGFFRFHSQSDSNVLTFSYVGYKTVIAPIKGDDNHLIIMLAPMHLELAEVKVFPGENPAHRIINRVVENRNVNNPEKTKSFICNVYCKMIFTVDPSSIKQADSLKPDSALIAVRSLLDAQHLFISENITEKRFLYPDKNLETVIASKVSGLSDPLFSLLMNQMQPFTFYNEIITISDKKYINPISKGSTNKYFFLLEDTVYSGVDTVFIISYQPGRNRNFDGLKGLLYINTNGYAIQNVIAGPVNKQSGGMEIKIQQQYEFLYGEQWFPKELSIEMNMAMPGLNKLRLTGIGRSYVSDVNLKPELRKRDFGVNVLDVDSEAHLKPDEFWENFRNASLSLKDIRTYHVLDSLGKVLGFDKKAARIQAIATGQLAMPFVDINVNKLLKYNDFEGVRAGLGLSTNSDVSRLFSIGGHAAYGFKDEAWKYGLNSILHLNRKKGFALSIEFYDDVYESGSTHFFNTVQSFNYDFYRDFLLRKFDRKQCVKGGIQFRAIKYGIFDISAESSHNQVLYDYRYGNTFENAGIFTPSFGLASVSVSVRYAYGERYIRSRDFVLSTGTKAPVFWFKFSKGLAGFLNGDYDYQRWTLRIDKAFYLKYLGKPSVRIDAGIVTSDVPAPLLFFAKGSFRTFNIDVPNSFATMRVNEFLSNRYVAVHFKHDFGKLLFGRRTFSPSPALLTSFAWGSLNNKHKHFDLDFKTMEKGFWESGLMINSILKTGIYDMGAGVYYRYGSYGFDNFEDNISLRASITFPFLQ